MYKDLVEVTQKCCDLMGIDVDVFVERDEETGRHYLCGRYETRMAFNEHISIITHEQDRQITKLRESLDITNHVNLIHLTTHKQHFLTLVVQVSNDVKQHRGLTNTRITSDHSVGSRHNALLTTKELIDLTTGFQGVEQILLEIKVVHPGDINFQHV